MSFFCLLVIINACAKRKINSPPIVEEVEEKDTDKDGITDIEDVDDDNNGLIEIYTIDDLNNIRYNLKGTSYKTSAVDKGSTSGARENIPDGELALMGYELKNDLDFSDSNSYSNQGENNENWTSAKWTTNTSGEGWTPIANDTDLDTPEHQGSRFACILDGKGFNIKNLFINKTNNIDKDDYVGLIGIMESSEDFDFYTEIRDLSLKNLSITASNHNGAVGGVVAVILNETKIADCHVEGSIRGVDNVGGIVGQVMTNGNDNDNTEREIRIENSTYTRGNVIGNNNTGGIIGSIHSFNRKVGVSISGCQSSFASVLGENKTGGIIGHVFRSVNILENGERIEGFTSVSINDCHSIANVSGNISVGGIGGNISRINMTNCISIGNITGNSSMGGIASGVSFSIIVNCQSSSSIVGINVENAEGDISFSKRAGGLVSGLAGSIVSNCQASGNVMVASEYAGGLIGSMIVDNDEPFIDNGMFFESSSNSLIINSFASGNVEGKDNVGGLVGEVRFNSHVINSYATGNVRGDQFLGGLIGDLNGTRGRVVACYATGNIIATGNNIVVGGLIGQANGKVYSCYATGNVEAKDDVGGLIGAVLDSLSIISFCYSLGNLNLELLNVPLDRGSLIGRFEEGKINYCYTTGNRAGSLPDTILPIEGSLVGKNTAGTILASAGNSPAHLVANNGLFDFNLEERVIFQTKWNAINAWQGKPWELITNTPPTFPKLYQWVGNGPDNKLGTDDDEFSTTLLSGQ